MSFKLIVVGMIIAGSLASRGDTVASFNGGNSTTAPDSYTGTTTDPGWTSAWTPNTQNGGTAINGTVTNANPLSVGTGNYLSVTNNGTAQQSAAVDRSYGAAADNSFSLSTAHTISFQLRIDESAASLASSFTTGTDRYQLFEGNAASQGTGAVDNWIIGAYGADPSGAPSGFVAKDWLLYNGDPTSGSFAASGSKWVDSGLAMTSGATYTFTINTNPTTKTYSATISSSLGGSFTSGTLDWRNFSANPTASGGTLGFGDQANSGNRAFSLDSVDISATSSSVPEPSSLALICGGLGALFCLTRRSRRGLNE